MLKSWRFQGPGETCIIAPRSLVSQEEQAAYLSAQLDRWLADPLTNKTVLEIYESIRGQSALLARRLHGQELHRYVKSEILEAFRHGNLVLMRMPHFTVFPALHLPQTKEEVAATEEPPPPVQQQPAKEQKTWIGFELVDQDGHPLPNVRYELELPNGKKRSGTLDQNGKMLVKDIDPGSCIISFPDLDAREIESPTGTALPAETPSVAREVAQEDEPDSPPVAASPGSTPASTPPPVEEESGNFLDLRLLSRGKARSGIAYTLILDENRLDGVTDAQGTVHQPVAETAAMARLTLNTTPRSEKYEITVGTLPPLDDLAGGQARLSNLGYRTGPADGKMGTRTRNALRHFQEDHSLEVTGEYDAATRNALQEIHDEKKSSDTVGAGSAGDTGLVDDVRYGLVFPGDGSSPLPLEITGSEGSTQTEPPTGTLIFSRVANVSTPDIRLSNAFDRLPPPAMLEVEDASYHHNSCVTLPALPTFGRNPAVPGQLNVEGEFVKAVKKFHPLVYSDFWRRTPGGPPAEEELWRRSGLVYVAVVYLFLKNNPSYRLLLAGHTDTTGKDEYNFELGELRARNFLYLLNGKREKWIENSAGRSSIEDTQRIVKYYADRRGWGCDPGEVNGQDSQATRDAICCFQSHFNADFGASLQVDGKFGRETWGAVFDLYMDELAALLETSVEGLAGFRQNLRFASEDHPAITCGERIPIDAPQRDNFRSETNRRVEVLFFHASDTPDLTAHLPGGKLRSGSARREASDIYSPESPKFVLINPRWWEHPASPAPFVAQFRIEDLGTENSDEVETEVPIGTVDPAQEEEDPWVFLDPFEEFNPGSSGKDDFHQLLGSEDRADG